MTNTQHVLIFAATCVCAFGLSEEGGSPGPASWSVLPGQMKNDEAVSLLQSTVRVVEKRTPAAETQYQSDQALERPTYDTVVGKVRIHGIFDQPLASCGDSSRAVSPESQEAQDKLHEAVKIFCAVGLGDLVEFFVDPRFKGNYDRLKGPDGWIEKAYLSYQGLHKAKDNVSAQEDMLLQSIHHFSQYPVVLTSFGNLVSEHITPERFPNLVLMHARSSATDFHKGFNLNKLVSMLFTKVKGGVVLDADMWVNRGVDVLLQRAFEETTTSYPYPIMPVHFASRDPESSDMYHFDSPEYTFNFKSDKHPQRSMRWGHAHPTWTYHALPWIATWAARVLKPEKTNSPSWLQAEGFVSDEPLLNMASWADGLTKQWCKFDIPKADSEYPAYLLQGNIHNTVIPDKLKIRNILGRDSKYYPKGIPYMFFEAHDAKDPENSYDWLSKLWQNSGVKGKGLVEIMGKTHYDLWKSTLPGDEFNRGETPVDTDKRKPILYDGKWFTSGKELKEYDPSLKCIA